MGVKSITNKLTDEKKYFDFWDTQFLPKGLPLLLGAGLGIVLALLLALGEWFFAIALVFVVPAAILLNKYPFIAIMVWLATIAFIPPSAQSVYIYWLLHRALIPAALAITILYRMMRLKGFRSLKLGWPELAMGLYLAYGISSILLTYGVSLPATYTFYDRVFVPFMAYLLIKSTSPSEKVLKRLIPFILAICVAEAIIGLLSWYRPGVLPALWGGGAQRHLRVTGTFNEPAVYTSFMMFLMLWLLQMAMSLKGGLWRLILLLAFALGMLSILFSFSRGSWLAASLVILGLLYLYPRPVLSLAAVVLPIIIILSADVLVDEVSYALERLRSRSTANDRLVVAHAGQRMFLAKPVFGWGYESYDDHDWMFFERVGDVVPSVWDIRQSTSHNTFLTILAEMGIVGFSLFIFPVIWLLVQTVRVLPRMPREGFWSWRLLIIFWLSFGFLITVSQFVDMRFFVFTLTLWWIILGLIANIIHIYLHPDEVDAPAEAQA
ncbi:MAG: O-antigen ligase family protein [Anaerolineae bacterium]